MGRWEASADEQEKSVRFGIRENHLLMRNISKCEDEQDMTNEKGS